MAQKWKNIFDIWQLCVHCYLTRQSMMLLGHMIRPICKFWFFNFRGKCPFLLIISYAFITKISSLENNLLTDLCPRFLTLHSRKAVRPMEALTLAWIPLMSRLGGSCNVEDGTMIAEPTIIPGKSLGNANGSSGWSGNGEDCIVFKRLKITYQFSMIVEFFVYNVKNYQF